jgi:hypothetical protein
LAAITYRLPAPTGDIQRLARAICGPDDDPRVFGAAVAIAENHYVRRAIQEQQIAVVERLRDATAIALAKGDNSFTLADARFLRAWLANREVEASIPKLLEKYDLQPRSTKQPGSQPDSGADAGKPGQDCRTDPTDRTPVEDWISDLDDIVPVRLKALLEVPDSIKVQQQALDLAKKHVQEEERDEYDALKEAIPDLKRLDRYERRAWSQQKRAIREFMNIKLQRMLDSYTAGHRSNRESAPF